MSKDNSRFLVSRREFAELCGIFKNGAIYVAEYIKKRYVSEDDKRKIDIRKPQNNAYLLSKIGTNPELLSKYNSIMLGKDPAPAFKLRKKKEVEEDDEPVRLPYDRPKKNDPDRVDDEDDEGVGLVPSTFADLKNVEEIKLKKISARLKLLEEQKLLGKLVSTELAAEAMMVLASSMMKTYIQSCRSWMIDVVHRNKLDSDEQARLNDEMIEMVNSSHDKALYSAKAKMMDAVKDSTSLDSKKDNDDDDDK